MSKPEVPNVCVSYFCAGLLPGQVFPTAFTIVNYDGVQADDYSSTGEKDAPGWCLLATGTSASVTNTYQWNTAKDCAEPASDTVFTPYVAGG